MTFVLYGISALQHWLAIHAGQPIRACSHHPNLPTRGIRANEAEAILGAFPYLSHPLHVLAGKPVKDSRPSLVLHHTWTALLPSRTFVRLTTNAYASTPELAFVQATKSLTLVDAIRLGFELCGTYSLDPTSPGGFRQRPPLTTPRRMNACLEQMAGAHGVKKARRAVRYLLPHSASPAETNLAMALTLPYTLGGYGLGGAELNGIVGASPRGRAVSGKDHLRCDLLWRDKLVGAEYDSDREHTGSERIARDSHRRNSLMHLGITSVTFTRMQFNSLDECDRTARTLAKYLGKRIQPRCPDFRRCQIDLRRCLRSDPPWMPRRR